MKQTKLERNALAISGMSMAEYFDSCLGTTMTLVKMSHLLGVARSTINKWIIANGRKWDADSAEGNRRAMGFEHMGFFGTQKQHCAHHGVNYHSVRTNVVRDGLNFVDALEKQIRTKVANAKKPHGIKARMTEAGIAQSYVYQIKRDYGITSEKALQIAIKRKNERIARKSAKAAKQKEKKESNDWASRQARLNGKTPKQVLMQVMKDAGGKWETIGIMCGMTGSAARNMFIRHGVHKKPIWAFKFQGVTASLLAHCKRLGLDYWPVSNYKIRNNLTPSEALKAYVEGRVNRHYWGVKAA